MAPCTSPCKMGPMINRTQFWVITHQWQTSEEPKILQKSHGCKYKTTAIEQNTHFIRWFKLIKSVHTFRSRRTWTLGSRSSKSENVSSTSSFLLCENHDAIKFNYFIWSGLHNDRRAQGNGTARKKKMFWVPHTAKNPKVSVHVTLAFQ